MVNWLNSVGLEFAKLIKLWNCGALSKEEKSIVFGTVVSALETGTLFLSLKVFNERRLRGIESIISLESN